MYTQGVNKILMPRKTLEREEIQSMAVSLGYSAYCYNGDIYVMLTKKSWIKTVFRLADFTGGI